MTDYIKKIADSIAGYGPQQAGTSIFTLFRSLAQEIAPLDTRDFLPAARYEFSEPVELKGCWFGEVLAGCRDELSQ